MLIDELKINAQNGNAEAQYKIGCLYSYGDTTAGADLDAREAFKWFRKSVKQKYPPAYNALGIVYENGEGVKRNLKKALKWYMKAAKANDVGAFRNLALCYKYGDLVKKDLKKSENYCVSAFSVAKKLAENDNERAQYILGWCYEEGKGGADQDEKEAVK